MKTIRLTRAQQQTIPPLPEGFEAGVYYEVGWTGPVGDDHAKHLVDIGQAEYVSDSSAAVEEGVKPVTTGTDLVPGETEDPAPPTGKSKK